MKTMICMAMLLALCRSMAAAETDTLMLSLQDAIRLAQEQSPSVQSARNTFLAAYWNYRNFRTNLLPSVTLSSVPYINKQVNKITQSDGTACFIRQDQFGADLSLCVNQNVSWTGGSIFLKSSLNRIDEFRQQTVAYSSQPLVVGFEQSLFGYNSLKWDKRIEPVRYSEAKKEYAEALEVISATTSLRWPWHRPSLRWHARTSNRPIRFTVWRKVGTRLAPLRRTRCCSSKSTGSTRKPI